MNNLLDKLIYTQVLTRAGFATYKISSLSLLRGSGVLLNGEFEHAENGLKLKSMIIKAKGDFVTLSGPRVEDFTQKYKVIPKGSLGDFSLTTSEVD